MNLSLATIADWTEGTLLTPNAAQTEATGYSIDSRTLSPGDVFFAVSGERYDAHTFVAQAFAKGAIAAVISHPDRIDAARLDTVTGTHPPLIQVDHPLRALQRLAARVRQHWGKRVIGITGSAGKTTTKEAIATVLATNYRVLKSHGNLNNEFGVPLQLLRLQPEDEIAVLEMGMSHAGEISTLTRIAAPDWGVVTNVGNAHTENFPDGIEGVARAKHELIAGLAPNGTALLNADDPRVAAFPTANRRTVTFGQSPTAHVRATQVDEANGEALRIEVQAQGEQANLTLQLLGAHNVTNALAAIAVGLEADIPLTQAAAALATLTPGDKRGQVLTRNGAKLINDCYNSNPEALRAMIRTLSAIPATRRILIAGEMLELGPAAPELHAACGRAAAAAGIDRILGVRGLAQHLVTAAQASGAQAEFVQTPEEAAAWLAANLQPGDAVLLKASRGVQLERALAALEPSPAS